MSPGRSSHRHRRPGLKIFVPITSMIVISLVFSLIAWLLRR